MTVAAIGLRGLVATEEKGTGRHAKSDARFSFRPFTRNQFRAAHSPEGVRHAAMPAVADRNRALAPVTHN
jgi:hypothetical protein